MTKDLLDVCGISEQHPHARGDLRRCHGSKLAQRTFISPSDPRHQPLEARFASAPDHAITTPRGKLLRNAQPGPVMPK